MKSKKKTKSKQKYDKIAIASIIISFLSVLISLYFGWYLEKTKSENEIIKNVRQEIYLILTKNKAKYPFDINDKSIYDNSKIKEILFKNSMILNLRNDEKLQNSINSVIEEYLRIELQKILIQQSKENRNLKFDDNYAVKYELRKKYKSFSKFLISQLSIIGIDYISEANKNFFSDENLISINPIEKRLTTKNTILHTNQKDSITSVHIIDDNHLPILATISGIVEEVDYSLGYGNYIVIKNNNGIRVKYEHLSTTLVKVNQKVYKNSVIGRLGSTGLATRIFLTYRVFINNDEINSSAFIKINEKITPKKLIIN